MSAIATGPQVAQTPTRRGADTAVDARANGQERSGEAERREYEGWRRRVDEATKLRDRFDKTVWSPLYERWATARMRGKMTDEISNPWQQFAEVVLPHLLGDEREILCRVNRVAAGEDPEEKTAFADVLANLATALPHACGVYKDALGRPGEFQRAVMNSLWSMGVMVLGFEPPRGMGAARGSRENEPEQEVDLNLTYADHNELADSGSPSARCISARRFLGDATFADFGRGEWFGEIFYLGVAEAKVRFPQWAKSWRKTHESAPLGGRKQDEPAGGDGVIEFVAIYTRRPSERLVIPMSRSAGVEAIVERQTVELGIEGLPVRLLGHTWIDEIPYPKPLLLRILGSGKAEDDFLCALFGSGRKLKSMTLVNRNQEPQLAAALRKGDADGVYEVDGDPQTALHQQDVGGLRSEYISLAEQARNNTSRNTGVDDLLLGVREPGDPNVPQVQARQGAIAARRAYVLAPTRAFEASVAAGLAAIALEKKELLHGLKLRLPGDRGMAVIDATQPVIGELLDYEFTCQVTDAVSQADEAQNLGQLIGSAGAYSQLLAPLGKQFRADLAIIEFLRKSRTPQADRFVEDLPQQQHPPPADQAAAAGGAAPQPAPQPGGDDAAAQYAELVGMLQQLPEGDPREEQILQALAQLVQQHPELQAQAGQQQAA